LVIGLPLAVIGGVFAWTSSVECDFFMEGCSGGSPEGGFFLGGLILVIAALTAWAVGRPEH
jgi:hypothetical protein